MADSPFGSALVIGADAIGGVAAGALGASATSVVVTSDWQEHRAAINTAGLLPIGDEDARSLSGLRAISNNELDALDSQFELIVIATKCAAVASAAQRAADLLTTSGTVLSMTNGVVDARSRVRVTARDHGDRRSPLLR